MVQITIPPILSIFNFIFFLKTLGKHNTSDWHSFIAPIANRLMDFSKRNPLLNLDQKNYIYSLDLDANEELKSINIKLNSSVKKILKRQKQIIKETGLNTLYLSWGTYEIQNKDLNRLPFYLIPIEIKSNKDKDEIEIHPDWDGKIVNPLLEKLLKDKFNLDAKLEAVSNWDLHLGIFNYKKYILLEEIGKMEMQNLSNPIRQLFDFNPKIEDPSDRKKDLDSLLISSADPSQRNIIKRSLVNDSFCVQGPPGTGKSQTISNIISANLSLGKRILFVSEKKAAIDVVYDRLKSSGLANVATQITDSSSDKKEFVQSLSFQWEDNKKQKERTSRYQDYSFSYSKLERFLDHLFRLQPTLGMSLSEALDNQTIIDWKLKTKETPKLERWSKQKSILNFLYSEIQKGHINTSDLPWLLRLHANLFSSSDLKNKLDLNSKIILENLDKIQEKEIDLVDLQKQCIQARVICGLRFKEKIEILKTPGRLKKFKTERTKYYRLQKELKNLKLDLQSWKKIPSVETIEFWRKNLNQKSWFNSKKRKAEKSLNKYLNGPLEITEKLFQKTEKYIETEKKWNDCVTKLKIEFQISEPEREIDELNLVLSKMEHQKSLFDVVLSKNLEELEYLDQLNPVLDKIQHSKKVLFGSSPNSIEEIEFAATTIKNNISFIVRNKDQFEVKKEFHSKEIEFYCQHPNPPLIGNEIFQSNVLDIFNQSAILKETDEKELNILVSDILNKRSKNHLVNAETIARSLKKEFLQLEDLLITPAGRLKQDQKNLKKEIRTGKRILTHEFSKTRSYKAIRELCEIESKNWIFSMKKVWMMNPLSVAEILPFESEQFDLLIIDEASQIPEEDIIPALYRAKQVIIVGDKMQMPPSNFFSGNEVGPSILDTAHFRLPNEMLQWHYRSQNPELITFSNHAFYDSQLIINPSLGSTEEALNFHFVEKSNYNEGTNPKEAEALISFLKNKSSIWNGSIGIGCFSLAQQKTIKKQLGKHPQLIKRIEDETLFVKNLENLQGDECDHLLISIGYGPNAEGKMNMNFGPLSKSGGHNRLNVLITRARLTVDVFGSFQPEDLQLTDNEGINYLKEYLNFIKEHKTEFNWSALNIDSENKKVEYKITDPTDLETILSRVNVLQSNGFAALVSTKLS